MRKPRWLFFMAILSAFALIAAACGDDGGDTEEPGAAGIAEECEADEAGCVQIAEGDPIKLGTLLVITGENASLGQDSQNGAVLAGQFLDTPNQIAGHDIQWVHEDDGCSAEGGQAGAQRLVGEENLVAVIGTSCSSAALGVADQIMSDAGIPLISPSNTGPALTDPQTHQEFYLRTAHNDKLQGAAVSHFARQELQAESAATIHDGSPYADGLQAVFSQVFEEDGGTITAQEAIQVGDTDFKPLLTDIAADEPDVLYYPIFVAEGALITQQARDTQGLSDADLMGSDGMFTPDWIEATGTEDANGVYISGPDLTAFADPEFYENEFLPAYEEEFGEEPQSVFHAHSFDAVRMLAAAIEDVAGTEGGTTYIPRTALRDRLFETDGFEGITGTLSCNETGDCQQTATMAVFVVENGAFSEQPVFSEELTLEEVGG